MVVDDDALPTCTYLIVHIGIVVCQCVLLRAYAAYGNLKNTHKILGRPAEHDGPPLNLLVCAV